MTKAILLKGWEKFGEMAKYAYVDDEDYEWLMKYEWSVERYKKTYSAYTMLEGNKVFMNHMIMMGGKKCAKYL